MLKTYICGICKTKPDQISHHKAHLETEKHKDKKELFELKLSKLNEEDLMKEYQMKDIKEIVYKMETIIDDKKEFVKKNKKTILEKEKEENELSEEEKELLKKMEEFNLISNREALKDKIHEIHNYLRNNGAGYGMNALKVFNILYGLKKIEENGLFEKVGLPEVCKFSSLVKMAEENKYIELWDMIYNKILDALNNHEEIRHFLFYEIPKNTSSSILPHLIKEIDNISNIEKSCNVQLSGKIYEYFIGRNKKDIEDLGAYFTDRHIVNYIYDKLNPQVNEDGTIYDMIDMFGGSGGFTTGYINYLNKSETKVNWENELKKVHHYDMNEDVIKSAGLEFFTLTGTIPEIGLHMGYKNSFSSEFNDKKFHYIITNPPYGGDKNNKSETQEKDNKTKVYIKNDLEKLMKESTKEVGDIIQRRQNQLKYYENKENQYKLDEEKRKVCLKSSSNRINAFAKKYNLKGNDKESISLIQIMDMLEVNGTAIGILKEGVFFDKKYKDIRKCLVQNFNVREVISVPQDQFENTSTKTSIIIFDNSEEKTSNIKFSDLILQKYEEDKFEEIDGWIHISESKDDICNVYDALVSEATIDELLVNENVSLNGKDYNKRELMVSDEYELVKLGDICDIKSGKQLDKKNVIKGTYPVYGGGILPIGFHNEYNNENCTIIAGTGNCGYIQFYKDKFWASQCFTLKAKNLSHNMYIYYICKSIEEKFIEKASGTVQKFIRSSQFIDFKIPVPKSEAKMNKWVKKISKPYDEKIEKEEKIKKLEAYVKSRIVEISEKEECEEIEFTKVLTYLSKKNKYKATDGKENGKYRFYTSSQDKIMYRDDYEFKEEHILIGRGGVASLHLTSMFSVSHDDVYVLKNINNEDNLKYVYYYMKNNIDLIANSFKGSTIKHCSKETLSQIKIKLPKNRDLIKALESIFTEIKALQNDVNRAEIEYKAYIQELSKDAIRGEQKIEDKVVQVSLTKEVLEKKDGKKKSVKSDTSSILSKSSKSSKSSENSIKCGFITTKGTPCKMGGKCEFNGRCSTHKNK